MNWIDFFPNSLFFFFFNCILMDSALLIWALMLTDLKKRSSLWCSSEISPERRRRGRWVCLVRWILWWFWAGGSLLVGKIKECGLPEMATENGEDGDALDRKETKWGFCSLVWMVAVEKWWSYLLCNWLWKEKNKIKERSSGGGSGSKLEKVDSVGGCMVYEEGAGRWGRKVSRVGSRWILPEKRRNDGVLGCRILARFQGDGSRRKVLTTEILLCIRIWKFTILK